VNKIHPSATTQAETIKRMISETYPFPVCPIHLSHLDVYATTQDSGQSVLEAEPKGRAADEIRQFYKFTISQNHKLENTHVQTHKSAKRA